MYLSYNILRILLMSLRLLPLVVSLRLFLLVPMEQSSLNLIANPDSEATRKTLVEKKVLYLVSNKT